MWCGQHPSNLSGEHEPLLGATESVQDEVSSPHPSRAVPMPYPPGTATTSSTSSLDLKDEIKALISNICQVGRYRSSSHLWPILGGVSLLNSLFKAVSAN